VTALSFERLLKSTRLAMPTPKRDAFIADRTIRLTRPDREKLDGKVSKSGGGGGGGGGGGRVQGLAQKLSKKLKSKKAPKSGNKPVAFTPYFDTRQRAIAKIHYYNHSGGGGAALKAHGKYIARDATRDSLQNEVINEPGKDNGRNRTRAHADHLERHGQGAFYDKEASGVDGAARLENWAKSDLRHFRVILSAEEGERLRDLPAYTREVMARAGAAIGTELNWVAVDHRDTDNVHTHIVIRGRRANGQDLVLPRDFIKHGFRGIAQDVATEWLGKRTPEQERLALERDVHRHAPTRLDKIIEGQAQDRVVDLNTLIAPNHDPALTQAAKARVQELARMGLAEERGRGLFRLTPDWRDKLDAMELHLDIRKRLMRDRMERSLDQQREVQRQIGKGLMDR
jgi:type IV secretory pathway VirD2 relaxase